MPPLPTQGPPYHTTHGPPESPAPIRLRSPTFVKQICPAMLSGGQGGFRMYAPSRVCCTAVARATPEGVEPPHPLVIGTHVTCDSSPVSPHPKYVTALPAKVVSTAVLGASGRGCGDTVERSRPVWRSARSSPPALHVHPPDHVTTADAVVLPVGKSPRICIVAPAARQCAAVRTKCRLMMEPVHESVFPLTLALTLTAQGASVVAFVPCHTAPAGDANTSASAAAKTMT